MLNKYAKKLYRKAIQPRYRKSSKKQKEVILNEFCRICGYHRKYAIALLQKPARTLPPPKHKTGRKRFYKGRLLLKVLHRLWLETELACSIRLKKVIPLWLPFYEQHYEKMDDVTRNKLLSLSPSTIDRLLKPTRIKLSLKKKCGTRPGKLLMHQVPIKDFSHWNISQPGFLEADTVAHCGGSMKGNFVWSLTLTDLKSSWTEIRAVWNKGAYEVCRQVEDIEKSLPFALQGLNTDSGTEFLNHHLIRYFNERKGLPPSRLTRSRPYKKNDNAHVEQKNWTHVRHLFGYARFEAPTTVKLMNDLYKNEWRLFQNYFMPNMKLIEKKRIGARYQRKYDTPQTPYERLLKEPSLTLKAKQQLTDHYKALDPFALRKKIIEKRNIILKLARK